VRRVQSLRHEVQSGDGVVIKLLRVRVEVARIAVDVAEEMPKVAADVDDSSADSVKMRRRAHLRVDRFRLALARIRAVVRIVAAVVITAAVPKAAAPAVTLAAAIIRIRNR
jgi:hypothetical protein